ncbi:MAG: DotU family type IV/VI secretion system protein [Gammaproteobacteria bacterium]|nr:DotU family type IV/VI secretion system protein [Gammaproteobacteria bacterium]
MVNSKITLTTIFSHLFAYVQGLRRLGGQSHPAYQVVRTRINSLLEESAARARDGATDPRDYDEARFAVCAWVDETLMSTPWSASEEWRRNLLQSELYGITNAGEEFFERLNRIPNEQNEVREVYFWCLGLGFTGRFCNPGDDLLLTQLKKATQRQLSKDSAVPMEYKTKTMFDVAYRGLGDAGGRENVAQKRWTPFRLVLLTVPPTMLGLLYLVYQFVLSGISSNVVARLGGG